MQAAPSLDRQVALATTTTLPRGLMLRWISRPQPGFGSPSGAPSRSRHETRDLHLPSQRTKTQLESRSPPPQHLVHVKVPPPSRSPPAQAPAEEGWTPPAPGKHPTQTDPRPHPRPTQHTSQAQGIDSPAIPWFRLRREAALTSSPRNVALRKKVEGACKVHGSAHTHLRAPLPSRGITEGWQGLEVGAGVQAGKVSHASPGMGQHPSEDAVSPTKQHLAEGPAPKATVGLPVPLSPPRGLTQRRATSRKQDLPTHQPSQAALPHMTHL